MKKGILTLVPTPIDETNALEGVALATLLKACESDDAVFVIEDLKPGRRRWLRWGLPREQVERFELLNEHTFKEQTVKLMALLTAGKKLFLMSDGGLPAFCDPGKELVAACHQQNIQVTATPFSNSVILALALSGFAHGQFIFEGFIPVKREERISALREIVLNKSAVILMDTPYRLKNLLENLANIAPSRILFLAMDLNSSEEELKLERPAKMLRKITNFKREFILILSPLQV